MDDFAKLLRVEGIGQVLATIDEDDDGNPVLHFRIPDEGQAMLQMGMSFPHPDYDKGAALAREAMAKLTEENAAAVVRLLVETRDRLREATP
jgi:hypothetical protein